jgi:hypothetical protein
MTSTKFKKLIEGKIPAKYIYISKDNYGVKSVPIYLIYYNSRVPNSKISTDSVSHERVFHGLKFNGADLQNLTFSAPVLLENYNSEIRANSLIFFVDLSGNFMSKFMKI